MIIIELARPEGAEVFPPPARWWPITDVVADLFPRELGALMTGYVEGWVPDDSSTPEA
ncbi:hypothetical protein NX801_10585 [Streptomyces sp. LP05-1]|uniref:Uncharacterized protein n=1 Tax=Streptomyces pyxinae TaxID=2970734 RepID=A0ABT2CFA6_9ACTN|nr:hypothetical protein [Streptomyces sp. LP05-1]MCS0636101.1 hypothetical protein [Streptomyces sp. LP05-1]